MKVAGIIVLIVVVLLLGLPVPMTMAASSSCAVGGLPCGLSMGFCFAFLIGLLLAGLAWGSPVRVHSPSRPTRLFAECLDPPPRQR
jgi:hypothetical protein